MSTIDFDITVFNRDQVRLIDLINQFDSTIPPTLAMNSQLLEVADELHEVQKDMYGRLFEFQKGSAFLFTASSAHLMEALSTDDYQSLFKYRDSCKEGLNFFSRVDLLINKLEHAPRWRVLRYANYFQILKLRRLNRKSLRLAKQQIDRLNLLLKQLDAYSDVKNLKNGFVTLNSEELWSDRCKAYDYLA